MHRENVVKIYDVIPRILAPNGRAPDLGSGGCWFESNISDCLYGNTGVLAQLVEHLLCKQEVRGSIPLDSIGAYICLLTGDNRMSAKMRN